MAQLSPHRVTNDLGAISGGSSRRRFVMLVDRHKFLALAGADDFLAQLSAGAARVVLGSVVFRPKNAVYHLDVIVGEDTRYRAILRSLAMATADRDGFSAVQWGDAEDSLQSSRPWGPFAGIRRRGVSARKRFQARRCMSNEHMSQVVEALWRIFLISQGSTPPAHLESTLD